MKFIPIRGLLQSGFTHWLICLKRCALVTYPRLAGCTWNLTPLSGVILSGRKFPSRLPASHRVKGGKKFSQRIVGCLDPVHHNGNILLHFGQQLKGNVNRRGRNPG